MAKFILYIIIANCIVLTGYAQTNVVQGNITGRLNNEGLQNAVVALLNKEDSTINTFTRSSINGGFLFKNMPSGPYILFISYPGFIDYIDSLEIKLNSSKNLGNISLIDEAIILKEFIVNGKLAVRIKGDTIEYNANSFKVRDGGSTEELLKKLPGIQVDRKGIISTYGKRVEKVLVDGEEFFGDDPTIATQNILAKNVDKVQVYDTRTDIDKLTGDTRKDLGKTVDIILKEEARHGYFGRVEGGVGDRKLYNGKGMYNRFNNKKKLSTYVNKSKTNSGILNEKERNQLGILADKEYDRISGYYLSMIPNEDGALPISDDGLPNATSVGGLYSDNWNKGQDNIYLSYKYNQLGLKSKSSYLSRIKLENSDLTNERNTDSYSLRNQQLFNIKLEHKIDSSFIIKFISAFTFNNNNVNYSTSGLSKDENQGIINKGMQYLLSSTNSKRWENQLLFTSLSKARKGRSASILLRLGGSTDKSDGLLNSTYNYYNSRSYDIIYVNQSKNYNGGIFNKGLKFIVVEPLKTNFTLIADVGLNNGNSNSNRDTYDIDSLQNYKILNETFSNYSKLNTSTISGNLTFRLKLNKWFLSAGGGFSSIQLKLDNLKDNNGDVNKIFKNILPQSNVEYNFSSQARINIYHNANVITPSILQMQYLPDNSDPINIYTGNPLLEAGINHTLGLNYSNFESNKGKIFRVNTGINIRQKDISTDSKLDTLTGNRIYTPVNVNGNYNWFFYGMHSWGDILTSKLKHRININASGGKNSNIFNDIIYKTHYSTLGAGYYLRYEQLKKYELEIGFSARRIMTKTDNTQNFLNKYWNYNFYNSANIQLSNNIRLYSEVNGDIYQQFETLGGQTNIIVWNVSLEKAFTKNNNLKITADINDIFNMNRGLTRNINSNTISELSVLRLGRYAMASLIFTFNKTGISNK